MPATFDVTRLEACAGAQVPRRWRRSGLALGLTAALACTARSSTEMRSGPSTGGGTAVATPPAATPPSATPPAPSLGLDEDGVAKLYPDAPGMAYHLGDADPNTDARLAFEQEGEAAAGADGPIPYWTVTTYSFEYSEGGDAGKTARVHIRGEGAEQRFDWQTQTGFLAGPSDLGDQEFTAYVRVRGIFDPEHAVFELKIRGGDHTGDNPPLASCALMTFAAPEAPGVSRFGKELDHPLYDYVNLPLRFDASLREGRWYGLKLVSYTDAARPDRVINRLYVDDDPFTPDGSPRNSFRLLTEYIDRAGVNTGRYDTLVNWRGYITTLRVDGVDAVDVALLSARPISAPAAAAAQGRSSPEGSP